jgi:hypothetical protein
MVLLLSGIGPLSLAFDSIAPPRVRCCVSMGADLDASPYRDIICLTISSPCSAVLPGTTVMS